MHQRHNGPLLTNFEFHNTGVLPIAGQLPPMGRYDGTDLRVRMSSIVWGDTAMLSRVSATELRFAKDDNELVGAHKTPTLRNITETAPYMHGGQIADLQAVMEHYNEAPLPCSATMRRNLWPALQLKQLEAFMTTLTAPLQTKQKWLKPPDG